MDSSAVTPDGVATDVASDTSTHDGGVDVAPECTVDAECVALDGLCRRGSCEGGRCVIRALSGTPCDDGRYCTVDTQCAGGECVGVERDCGDGLECTADVCDETLDRCVVDVEGCGCLVDGDCDDDNACTLGDACGDDLFCRATTPVVCEAPSNPCMMAACNPDTGACDALPVDDGTPCDDGQWCTEDDRCTDGVCGGTSRDCADEHACTVDACDDAVDRCVADATACGCQGDGDCDDGDACTLGDGCGEDLFCLSTTPVVCDAPTNPCMVATCDPSTGDCGEEPVDDGLPCDDGLWCTTADQCVAGACSGAARVCTDGFACTVDACDDGLDRCVSDATSCGCQGDGDCDDGDACTLGDACGDDLFCVATTPVVCDAPTNPCMVAMCDPETGACAEEAAPDDMPCDDGLWCTVGDKCLAGTCGGAARACSDQVVCTVDACDEALDRCVADATSCGCQVDGDCDDGDACSLGDECGADLFCVSTTPVVCDEPSNPCMVAVCDPETGACAEEAGPDNVPCDDGQWCTIGDKCLAGSCQGAARGCSDQIACTVDACNEALDRCVSDASSCGCDGPQDCDDGDACTIGDACGADLACVTTTPVVCEAPTNPCMVAVCDPGTGACGEEPAPDDTPCDDGDWCTVSDRCEDGACGGSARSCSDPYACTVDSCDEAGDQCVNDDGACECFAHADCDDGNACNGIERCSPNGQCQAGTAVTCTQPSNTCRESVCDPVDGSCFTRNKADDTPCNDGSACTVGDSCVAGQCQSGPICPEWACTVGAGTCSANSCSYNYEATGTVCGGGFPDPLRCCGFFGSGLVACGSNFCN